MMNPEELNKEDEKNPSAPALEYLWEFSCELTRGRCVTSMTWNKKNPVTKTMKYIYSKYIFKVVEMPVKTYFVCFYIS